MIIFETEDVCNLHYPSVYIQLTSEGFKKYNKNTQNIMKKQISDKIKIIVDDFILRHGDDDIYLIKTENNSIIDYTDNKKRHKLCMAISIFKMIGNHFIQLENYDRFETAHRILCQKNKGCYEYKYHGIIDFKDEKEFYWESGILT